MDLSPRAVIAGRYRVDTRVGAGGMGEVWLGEQIALGARVAIKTLLPAAAMNHEVVARFKREAYILGKIRSDHVARVVDFVADDVYGLVLVMEFVEGDALSRILQERALTVEEGIDLAFGLALALKDLHGASIIHRDLKPGNVMMQLLPDGHRRAVVVDFGVSRLMSDNNTDEDEELTGITRADMAVGTIEYMAPEQILNSRNVAPGSDIYAAGAMLFRACAGRHIFGNLQSDTELAQKKLTTDAPPIPFEREDALAKGFAAVVAKMIKRRPSERYKQAEEVYQDLLPLRNLQREMESTTASIHVAAAAASAPRAAPHPAQAAAPAPAPAIARTVIDPTMAAAPPAAPAPVGSTVPASVAGSVAASAAPRVEPNPAGPAQAESPSLVAAATSEPARQGGGGVPVAVTLVLVAAALAGGVFLGPRIFEAVNASSGNASSGNASSGNASSGTSGPSVAPPTSATTTAAAAIPGATAAPSASVTSLSPGSASAANAAQDAGSPHADLHGGVDGGGGAPRRSDGAPH